MLKKIYLISWSPYDTSYFQVTEFSHVSPRFHPRCWQEEPKSTKGSWGKGDRGQRHERNDRGDWDKEKDSRGYSGPATERG